MTYRTTPPGRLYVCPACASAAGGPAYGGNVICSSCGAPHALPERGEPSSNKLPTPKNDPDHLQQLRAHVGRLRQVPPTLQTVLGGTCVQPGREQEAIVLWQSLRARSHQGDLAASEDMTVLTLMLARMSFELPEYPDALLESACDAAVLPRHRQELLGLLTRRAAANGDRGQALRFLSAMIPGGPDIETDSEHRLSAAAIATLDQDWRHVIEFIGSQKDSVPIADSLMTMAATFRANARERNGHPRMAVGALRDAKRASEIARVIASFPALDLCAQSAKAYSAERRTLAARKAAEEAGGEWYVSSALVLFGCVVIVVCIWDAEKKLSVIASGIVGSLFGFALLFFGRIKTHYAGLAWANAVSLPACILAVEKIGPPGELVSPYRFTVQVVGPAGPYSATYERSVPEHAVLTLVGSEILVWANPNNLQDITPEEE